MNYIEVQQMRKEAAFNPKGAIASMLKAIKRINKIPGTNLTPKEMRGILAHQRFGETSNQAFNMRKAYAKWLDKKAPGVLDAWTGAKPAEGVLTGLHEAGYYDKVRDAIRRSKIMFAQEAAISRAGKPGALAPYLDKIVKG